MADEFKPYVLWRAGNYRCVHTRDGIGDDEPVLIFEKSKRDCLGNEGWITIDSIFDTQSMLGALVEISKSHLAQMEMRKG